MKRICFQLFVRPEKMAEYKERHKQVWPEMLEALATTGWKNYSLFLSQEGLLIGYFETENLEASLEGMSNKEINQKWQTEMSSFFLDIDGKTPDTGFIQLEEVFNLENQLEQISQ